MVTGGAGFIGSNFVLYMLAKYPDLNIVVYDKLTYAGNLNNLRSVDADPRYTFVHGDICDAALVDETVTNHGIDTIVNFAAETHVDRSIMNPDAFIQTSVYGTYVLLEAARKHQLERFHQISTDEVYGHIPAGHSSMETDNLVPRSPYAASKASADLLVNSYYITYELPVTITRGSNNIGPYQYPEKVVPLFATNALDGERLPLYGDGRQMREYQFVVDHCEAIDIVLQRGVLGEAYNVGTGEEMENVEMVEILLETLDCPPLAHPPRQGPRRVTTDATASTSTRSVPSAGNPATHRAKPSSKPPNGTATTNGGGAPSKTATSRNTTNANTPTAGKTNSPIPHTKPTPEAP